MHKRISFHGDATLVNALVHELAPIAGVIAITHQAGGSAKPPATCWSMEVLNRDADEVLRRAAPVSGPTAAASGDEHRGSRTRWSIGRRKHLINTTPTRCCGKRWSRDLRNRGRITMNYLVLMALGGVIAAAALLFDPITQTMAFVGASIIAPGFEPLAKIAQGLVLREVARCAAGRCCRWSSATRCCSPAPRLTYRLLAWGDVEAHRAAPAGRSRWWPRSPSLQAAGLLASAAAATAGVLMVVSLRDLYVVGPLMVLVLICGGFAFREPRWAPAPSNWPALAARRAVGGHGLGGGAGGRGLLLETAGFHRRRPLT